MGDAIDKPQDDIVLQMKGITKEFPGVVALKNVSFSVKRATIHALVGENGAGKSTLMKVLCGVEHADSGEILFKGIPTRFRDTSESIQSGICMIYQELNLVSELTVAENIFIGRYPMRMGIVHWNAMFEHAENLIKQYDLDIDVHAEVSTLTVSQMQMLEIIKAISYHSDLIVMDEPTSSITEREVKKLFSFIRMLISEGKTVIYISHKLDEVFEIANEISILRDGQLIESKQTSELKKDDVIRMMVNRELKNLFPKKTINIGNVVMEVRNLSREGVFEDVSFEVRKGEILGVAGLMGSKRTELVRAIAGLDRPTSGKVYMHGQPSRIRNVRDAIDCGISMVSEDRKRFGLVLVRSIRENITLPNLNLLTRGFITKKKKEVNEIRKYTETMQVKMASLEMLTGNLSGGNQQKVVLTKWLMSRPKVLLLDEPTRGIDVGSKVEIYKLIGELASSGIAIVLISSEMPEIIGLCDRVIIMHEGKCKGMIDRSELSQEAIMLNILS
ncbi:MAG: sugar ABC transporter ATP-binding protein [Oscillospiraceae bacterium]|nr:sugar ABC transporter ATP-binding protein [Oscillospiraceae bacterium]